jgi:hypothetical protein
LDGAGHVRLGLRLLSIAKLLGLHQLPDDAQLTQLAAFVCRRFPDLTEVEVSVAVERWAAGEIAPEVRLFGALSLDWLGSVLSAYREDAAAQVRRERLERERREREAADQEPRPELPDEFHHQLVLDYVRQNHDLPYIADWTACWRHLRREKLLPDLDPTERGELLDLIRNEVHEARRQARRPDDVPLPTDAEGWNHLARTWRARKYYETFHLNEQA